MGIYKVCFWCGSVVPVEKAVLHSQYNVILCPECNHKAHQSVYHCWVKSNPLEVRMGESAFKNFAEFKAFMLTFIDYLRSQGDKAVGEANVHRYNYLDRGSL